PAEVGAADLQAGGITGRGVTVAVVDSGVSDDQGPLQRTSENRDHRIVAQYDVILAREDPGAYRRPDKYNYKIHDPFGHGTHVTSIIASSGLSASGHYEGVAPGVSIVSVRVLNRHGAGRYFDVIRGIQWVVDE